MQSQKLTIVNFAERFRNLVEASGLSQKELATRLGVSEGAIVNYKGGRVPKAEELLSIAAFFDVKMEWLLCGEDAKPSGTGGPGNAPMYNPGLGAAAKIAKAASMEEEAKDYRSLAAKLEKRVAKLQGNIAELLEQAEWCDDFARSVLEDDDDEDDDD